MYVDGQGRSYVVYTPLFTNATPPAAPLGSYFISSPQWPSNGCTRGFELTTNGLSDIYSADSEFGYGDLPSLLQQITNGNWTILFTNATTTNHYTFKVTGTNLPANVLVPTIITFPQDGSVILSTDTNFSWQLPAGWNSTLFAETYDNVGYYQSQTLGIGVTNWDPDAYLPPATNYSFNLRSSSNPPTPLFIASIPINTNTLQPIASGWATTNIFETGSTVYFSVYPSHGTPSQGHSCLGFYTFEDNYLFANDFSGSGNYLTYAWFSVPPTIVTNDAAYGNYSGGLGGSGWFSAPDSIRSIFGGSFSVSLWLKTTNVHGLNTDDQYSSAGIVSDLSSDYNHETMPMGQAGTKLNFYTGGSTQNIIYSKSDINTGKWTHVVTTRDQQTGEKCLYVNGVLESSAFSSTDILNSSPSGGVGLGYNNGNVFTGELDQISIYSGVLSSNDVAYLHANPGTNVADIFQLSIPVARYDFEDTNNFGTDSSGHNNSANCSSGNGGTLANLLSTNAAVGTHALLCLGDSDICFYPGSSAHAALSNALSRDFSVTAWVNTTNIVGQDYNNAYFGANILFNFGAISNSTIPLSITGSKVGFTINDSAGLTSTLHSTNSVNDGHYHFIAVTRNSTSGLMSVYVDGLLDSTLTGPTNTLLATSDIYLAGGYYSNYVGLLDDVRIYKNTLGPDDVASLAGLTSFNRALGTTNLAWTNNSDISWLVESTNTLTGLPYAAQSGIVTNSQTSTLSTTVTGPATVTFSWSSIANDTNQGFDLEFFLDDPNSGDLADIYGNNDWSQAGPYNIPAGQHTVGWTAFAYGDTDTNQAGFVDHVVITPVGSPVLFNAQKSGTNLQFQFMSRSGFNQLIQYSTNLSSTNWQDYTNLTGDGTLKTIPVPFSTFSPSKQGFVRVLTQ